MVDSYGVRAMPVLQDVLWFVNKHFNLFTYVRTVEAAGTTVSGQIISGRFVLLVEHEYVLSYACC